VNDCEFGGKQNQTEKLTDYRRHCEHESGSGSAVSDAYAAQSA